MSSNQLYTTMVYPAKRQPVRLPTFPSVSRTAVLDLSAPLRVSVGSNNTRMFLCPQANYPAFLDYTFASQYAYAACVGYGVKNGSGFGPGDLATPDISSTLAYGTGFATTWDATQKKVTTVGLPTITGSSTFADPAFVAPIIGTDETIGGPPFVYSPCDGLTGTQIVVQFNGGMSATSVSLELDYWISPGEFRRISTNPVVGGSNWQVFFAGLDLNLPSGPCWVRPVSVNCGGQPANGCPPVVHLFVTSAMSSFSIAPTTTATYTATVTAASPSYAFMPLPTPVDFFTTSAPFQNTRVTATALALENVTKVLNKEGTIMCGRLQPSNTDPFKFTAGSLALLHPEEKCQLPMERGLYTYCAPANSFDRFKDYAYPLNFNKSSTVTLSNVPTFDLSFDGLYNCMVFQDPDGGTLLSAVVDYHLEFRSTSVLWPLSIATSSVESLHSAVQRMARGPFFSPHRDSARLLLSPASQPRVLKGQNSIGGRKQLDKKQEKPRPKRGRAPSRPQQQPKAKPAAQPAAQKKKGG